MNSELTTCQSEVTLSDIRLESLFDMEEIEQGLYRGQSWDLGFRALFGGQVLGQSIAAAYKTV
jgi:acyl-CoA thioesterase-2